MNTHTTTRSRRAPLAVAITVAFLMAGCTTSPPPPVIPEIEARAAEFGEVIESDWTLDLPGVFGNTSVVDGVGAVYRMTREDRLHVVTFDAESGEVLQEHTAAPTGEVGTPLLGSTTSAGRRYPAPTMTPLLISTRTDATSSDADPVLVHVDRGSVDPFEPSELHVTDARTGEQIDLTVSDSDLNDSAPGLATMRRGAPVLLKPIGPPQLCRDTLDACIEISDGLEIRVDVTAREVGVTPGPIARETSTNFAQGSTDYLLEYRQVGYEFEEFLVRVADGDIVWERPVEGLFEDEYTALPEVPIIRQAGDVILVQGYQAPAQGETETTTIIELYYASSRTLLGLDATTGETLWTLEGADALCYTAVNIDLPDNATVAPVCTATSGHYVFDRESGDYIDRADLESSLVGVNVADATIAWEVEGAGALSLLHQGRQADVFVAPGARYVPDAGLHAPALIDALTGETTPLPAGSGVACVSERDEVDPKLDGTNLRGFANFTAGDFPGGWWSQPCGADTESEAWTVGAVRTVGATEGNGRVIVTGENALIGFTVPADKS